VATRPGFCRRPSEARSEAVRSLRSLRLLLRPLRPAMSFTRSDSCRVLWRPSEPSGARPNSPARPHDQRSVSTNTPARTNRVAARAAISHFGHARERSNVLIDRRVFTIVDCAPVCPKRCRRHLNGKRDLHAAHAPVPAALARTAGNPWRIRVPVHARSVLRSRPHVRMLDGTRRKTACEQRTFPSRDPRFQRWHRLFGRYGMQTQHYRSEW